MSFTIAIKEEISKIQNSPSERIAELSGYIRNGGIINNHKIVMTSENKFIVDRIVKGIRDSYNTEAKIDIIENLNFSKKDLYQITINENVEKILQN